MIIMVLIFGYLAYIIPNGVYTEIEADIDSQFANQALNISIATYIFGLFFAWFLIDAIKMSLLFDRLWKLQKGIRKFENEKKNPFFNCVNPYCVTSWCCFCSCVACYYLGCVHCILRHRIFKYGYPTMKIDSNSDSNHNEYNVIGSESGEFVVTWQDFQNFKDNKPVYKRDVIKVLNRLYGSETDIQQTEMLSLSPEIKSTSALVDDVMT